MLLCTVVPIFSFAGVSSLHVVCVVSSSIALLGNVLHVYVPCPCKPIGVYISKLELVWTTGDIRVFLCSSPFYFFVSGE